MSCCTPKDPKAIVAMILRMSFGISLLFVGVDHYMTLGMFKGMVADGLGPLALFGTVWALILPGLMIVGGGLIAIGMYRDIAAWTAGIALGSIPVGMLAKPILSGNQVGLGDMMPMAINAFVWLIVLVFVVKYGCCSGGSCSSESGCGGGCCCTKQ